MADVFAEVDEALKQERLEKLWADYGKWIIAAIVAIILGTAASSTYRSWNESVQIKQTNAVLEALDAEDMPAALTQASENVRPGLRGIALLTAAGTLISEDKPDEALALYEKAADDSAIPAELRDLAIIMSVRLGADKKDAQEKKDTFLSRLQSVSSNAKSPWRFHAHLESAVILAHFSQAYKAAQAELDIILETPQLPETLYNKARALKHVYALRDHENSKVKSEGS
ncbi:MAG: hypothetical protein DHS20C02_12550 [Micavibrio sp.]|nr:MAG: hypothetical protein DHS20C02_12550 [Micavibrio sp.]